ncbi:ceramide phosphoethanolamine synthase [Pectinophora gossypiella]|uniref:ceramide phosphoethanolamine synthase n=1 Tax=Pectinophora gossypiella TaxID=13191 RepID=UPI00214E314D|nr:ceramide phosphoethanolamine synthase [Pectinophora gossypiella]
MMWPASQASKVLTLLLLCILVYCIYMDTFLFLRIRNYKIDVFEYNNRNTSQDTSTHLAVLPSYEDVTWVPCSINPLCHPTVKGLMVDPVNHYIYGPLCAIVDIGLGISENMLFLTPNMISFFHVFIAFIGAKLLTCQALALRRVGIVLFQLRMFLDDLDGHVARERKHIKGERSEVGTLGYWVDGISDLVGVVAMMLGILWYLKCNPPRRGYKGTPVSTLPYHQLKEINSTEDIEKDHTAEVGISYKTKVSFQRMVQVIGLFSGQMVLSSLAWNRYIDVYQELLENCTDYDVFRRETMFKSGVFFFATGLWRIVNPHSYLHLLSLAVFCDKTWGFLKAVHYTGYVLLVIAVGTSEYLVGNIRSFVISDSR